MANTYSQINIHCVFAVKSRENVLSKQLRPMLFAYISGILAKLNCFSLAVNGHKDHVHIFFELPVTANISDVMGIINSNSSKWINENKYMPGKFEWQPGYGAFSHSHSQRHSIINYIKNQEYHHSTKTFREEYLAMLNNFEIEFKNEYVFEFYD